MTEQDRWKCSDCGYAQEEPARGAALAPDGARLCGDCIAERLYFGDEPWWVPEPVSPEVAGQESLFVC